MMVCKIGFLTSRRVNVGDEFIREGIRAVLDRLNMTYTPLYVHKLSEASLHTPDENETFIVKDKYWDSDLFIQSGAPVYWHLLNGQSTSLNSAWHQWMWKERILKNKEGRPVFINLGAGSCQPWGDMGDAFLHDADCVQFAKAASDRAALTTVRDPVADHLLKVLQLPHETLPCPAFLAACRCHISVSTNEVIGVNLMALGGHYDLCGNFDSVLWQKQCFALSTELRKIGKLLFIAHDQPEAEFMLKFALPGERIFLSGDWRDYFDVYAACHIVVANRVHGAVCAAGFGVPAIILGNDTRAMIGDYIGIPRYHVRELDVIEVIQHVRKFLDTRDDERSRLLGLRDTTINRYKNLLAPIIEQVNVSLQNTMKSRREQPVPLLALVSVAEVKSEKFVRFMQQLNALAAQFSLRTFTNWSKVWEYPWLWFHGLSSLDWPNMRVLDFGSELSPMPWFFASLGAQVTLVETDAQWIPTWEKIKQETGLTVDWRIVTDEILPFADDAFDVVTSFSVIEHQSDKVRAVNEVARVLNPGGTLAISFDICEPDMGMTFPEWNGKALTMKEFEEWIWNHPAFDNDGQQPHWNIEDCAEFIQWHLQSAPHHNYVVGAAILTKQHADMKNQTEKQVNVEQFDLQSCRNILIPRFDTFGDIVLLQGFLQALLDFVPDARITLLVREGYDQLQSLFPERVQWRTIRIHPYKNEPNQENVLSFLNTFQDDSYDLLLTTAYNRTWIDDLLAVRCSSARRITAGHGHEMTAELQKTLTALGQAFSRCPYDEIVLVEERSHETAKYQVLWERLSGQTSPLPQPQLVIPPDIETRAEEILADFQLPAGRFIFCCPAGIATVRIKQWPAEHFAAGLAELEKIYDMRALLIGHTSEKPILDNVLEFARQYGANPVCWIGKDGEIPLIAALAQKACCYLGNDTGLMHFAAALNIPVFAIFGGGHWPRFAPCTTRGRVFVAPLPCFYCSWNCLFNETYCINSLPAELILQHIMPIVDDILQGKGDYKVVEEKGTYEQLFNFCIKTVEFLKYSETDRAERLKVIQELHEQLAEIDTDRANRLKVIEELQMRLTESETDRAERLKVIQELHEQLAEIDTDRANRLKVIEELQTHLTESETDRAERLKVIQQLQTSLSESETDRAERLKVIQQLQTSLSESETDRAERLKVIQQLQTSLSESDTDRAERLKVIEELQTRLTESETDRVRIQQQLNELQQKLFVKVFRRLHLV
ncbi:methyltransferase type 11 [Candidatus Vecturithrix granuli]|uniref:Methyltransferase type 11 n=1 Tax=Vecturithrix granuli TaxID=1499967 RepID=A0A081BW79_VECG1|nr:methyltransferase type 11 [Candidatus Vecturithrix granuli]